MKKEFVPYEQALELKQLGFDGKCFAAYESNGILVRSTSDYWNNRSLFMINESTTSDLEVLTPLYQQVFKWFREKYNLISDIQYYGNWNFEIFRIGELAEPMDDVNVDYTFKGGTYEESELECLKKLIEIVKSK